MEARLLEADPMTIRIKRQLGSIHVIQISLILWSYEWRARAHLLFHNNA